MAQAQTDRHGQITDDTPDSQPAEQPDHQTDHQTDHGPADPSAAAGTLTAVDPGRATEPAADRDFRDLGVAEEFVTALETQGITAPFPIQELTIPLGLSRSDVIGQARTGTGKTLAFGLPLLDRVEPGAGGVQALVVTPTRELCIQVAQDLTDAATNVATTVLTVYGGVPLEPQRDALRQDAVDIVVGTPGRLLDHVRRGNLILGGVQVLVLDEADRMLDMGFIPDVEQLISLCGEERQTLLFSATMPADIVGLARRYMEHPTFIRAEDDEPQVAPETDQHFFIVHRMDKPRVLARILQSPEADLATVFVRTKRMADRLVDELRQLGLDASPIHGDLRQARRERNLERFRNGKSEVLVATEVAARGLDIDKVTHVINYDIPDDERMYLHRIGRTGRAGAAGTAVTFAQHDEVERMNSIRKRVGASEDSVHEVFSTSDLLTELFDLPDRTPWDRFGDDGNGDGSAGSSGQRSSGRGPKSQRSSRSGRRSKGGSSDGTRSSGGDRSSEGDRSSKGGPGDGGGDGSSRRQRSRHRSRGRAGSPDNAGGGSDGGSGDSSSGDAAGGSRGDRTRTRVGVPSAAELGDDAAAERTRTRKRREPRQRDAGDDRGRRDGDRSRSSDDGSDDDGDGSRSRRRSRERGASSERDRSDQRTTTRETTEPTDAGDEARGEGRPTITRRVKVEHIP